MSHLRINQVVEFTSKMFEKHPWKNDILSKDAGHRLAVFYISGTLVGNGLRKIVLNVTFFYPLKIKNLKVSDVLRGYGNVTFTL